MLAIEKVIIFGNFGFVKKSLKDVHEVFPYSG
jgi:hypothetical protein